MKTRTKTLIAGALIAATSTLALATTGYADGDREGAGSYYRAGGHAGGPQMAHGRGGPGMYGGGMHGGGMHGGGMHGGGAHGGGAHGGGMVMMESFDGNQDGTLTQAEIDAARGERHGRFDADQDGRLSLAEYEKLWLDAMRGRLVDRFQDLDADGDAAVTVEEFARPFAKMVARMDRNGDGEVSAADFRRRHHDDDDD